MTIKELKDKAAISRRSFLQGLSVIGASAALVGCGDSGGGKTYMEEDTELTVPDITEKVYSTSAGQNCESRCITLACVKDGVLTRIITDEKPDQNIVDGEGKDEPQRRACIKCRSNKQRVYRSDRLLFPMKQTKERGDVTGFVKISWEQAFSEIAEKTLAIKNTYGARTLHSTFASGDTNEVFWAPLASSRLLNMLGGSITVRGGYSRAIIAHCGPFFFGSIPTANFDMPANSRQDIFNSDILLIWGANPAEAPVGGSTTPWYVQQFKEKSGSEVIQVDSRLTTTGNTMATDFVAVVPGTDPAMIHAMIYEMIINTWNEDGTLKADPWLDEAFIRKYVHGFFDDPVPTHYNSDVSAATYIVPNGTSLSAYIMGTDNRLVLAGVNGATSVYPAAIGYNSYDTRNASDPLRTATTPIYGQVVKTPEWAAAICGTTADKIREMAYKLTHKKVTIWATGGGLQRSSEGEQLMLSIWTLGAITGNFGLPGRHVGHYTGRGVRIPFLVNPGASSQIATLMGELYDFSKITTPFSSTTFLPKYSPLATTYQVPQVLWPDIIKNGGTGHSDYNDGQVKRLTKGIKALYCFGGNFVNQSGQANKVSGIIKDRTNVELIVVADLSMTPSAKFADYILPATTSYEEEGATGGLMSDFDTAAIAINKAIEPLGEAKPDFDIFVGLAKAMGFEPAYSEGKTITEWTKQLVEPVIAYHSPGMTFEEWKKAGYLTVTQAGAAPIDATIAAFRADPTAYPLPTPSGKFEVYSQAMVEDYLARGYNNSDSRFTLLGPLHDGSTAGRYVYPIPMYIPMIEGKHADGSHPDPLGMDEKGYTFSLSGWHSYKRVHSTQNNNAYLNELYKKDSDGNPAFMNPSRAVGAVWDDNVYEPVWINPADAVNLGISEGDRVVLANDRGSIYASAMVTQRIRKGWLGIAEGAWTNGDNADGKPDVGGCLNVLTKLLPSRIGQGNTLNNDTRVKIYKA
ncbi:molybdopterin-dependent oxidoreductase [Seleniivibrio woodruffii]|uniref:molybdopterin-dependent oxidoreductase n=1 Tax=Seleniivibrio woodruffii TaxID=1078050 RepID=UPI00240A24F4|nr:molybdopterin-dependent oxidoreductase [Seleniivibrio woodruffii]